MCAIRSDAHFTGFDVSSKLIQYLELGTSNGSHTVPALNLPPQDGTHRILHIHQNKPGVLGEINSKLFQRGINVLGQYLKTNEQTGYVILDVNTTVCHMKRKAGDELHLMWRVAYEPGTLRAVAKTNGELF
jgi:Domain of unknown function (DUF4982)